MKEARAWNSSIIISQDYKFFHQVQFHYTRFLLPPERHKSSAASISTYLRRGPLSYFRSECWTGGESMAAPLVNCLLAPPHHHRARGWAGLFFKSSARPERESNPV